MRKSLSKILPICYVNLFKAHDIFCASLLRGYNTTLHGCYLYSRLKEELVVF